MPLSTVGGLFDRMACLGQGAYGLSDLTQGEHALQSAALARGRNLGDALTIAALFHDIGHLRSATDEALADRGIDDRHEISSARILDRLFGPDVSEPARLHVLAKRYLCTVEPAYADHLSDDSKLSLTLQGGAMTPADVAAFEAEPHHDAAVALRRVDDAAKVPGLVVPALETYRATAEALAERFARR